MARSKVVNIEGDEFKIAPLNIDQVEEHLGSAPNATDDTGNWRSHLLNAIAWSLNNASGAENGDRVTPESLRKRLDLITLPALYKAVLEISGLRTVESGASSSGESQAAPEAPSPSATSVTA